MFASFLCIFYYNELLEKCKTPLYTKHRKLLEYKEKNKPHQLNKKENNQEQELQGGKTTKSKTKNKVPNVPETITNLNIKTEQQQIKSIKANEGPQEKGIEEAMETTDLQELVNKDIENELKSGADFKAERSVKRWCRDHYLNYNSFRRVKIMAKLLERILRDIVAPRKKD